MDLQQLYKKNFPKVVAYVLRNSGQVHDAQDIFQEAVTVAWYNYRIGKFDDKKGSFDAYVITIAKNKWIDHLKKSKRLIVGSLDEETFTGAEEPVLNFIEAELKIEKLLFTFQQIGDKCKDILTSYYYKKQRLETIAQQMNTTADVIKTQKSRCIKKLKELMNAS